MKTFSTTVLLLIGGIVVVSVGIGMCAEPPAEATPRPPVPRFIVTTPVVQVDGRTVSGYRGWTVLYDSSTREEYLVIDSATVIRLAR